MHWSAARTAIINSVVRVSRGDDRRQVIDLPEMSALQVVEHQVIKRRCLKCKTWHTPKLDLSREVLGQGRMGHGIASLVSCPAIPVPLRGTRGGIRELRTTLRLPMKSVQTRLQQIYRLKLSVGEIVELTHAVANAGQNAMAEIKAAILKHAHVDETGWREDGNNGYAESTFSVWSSSTSNGLRAFEFHFSRAGAIPKAFLDGLSGTLVTDFYCGYNGTDGKHQRCWVHCCEMCANSKTSTCPAIPNFCRGSKPLFKHIARVR